MKWTGRRQSENVEDRRGISGKGIAGFGGIGAIIVALIIWLVGGNPSQLFNVIQETGTHQTDSTTLAEQNDLVQFVSVVLADTEDVWEKLFAEMGKTYVKPRLVLYTDAVQSACGNAQASTGPFYCSADSKVYIDLGFLEELQKKLDAPGDFTQAYIIAHEIGHHVQNLLGDLDKIHEKRAYVSEKEYNDLSVRLELQADFYAGVWAHHAQKMKNILENGDIEEAVNAAGAVGDDRIQMNSQGYVIPDSFTHGTSEQRARWFLKGFKTGDVTEGNTFAAQNL
jgi:predicted metalloprotease